MKKLVLATSVLLAASAVFGTAQAGDLEPPGAPAPTMKTLDEVEPRTPVQSLPGTAASLYRINQPGSYYLTGDIVAPVDVDGIFIAASDVTLDLRGFTISSAGGTALSARGIDVNGPRENIVIGNGTVRGFPAQGIFAQSQQVIAENLRLENNGDDGIVAGAGSVIRNCTARNNGDFGILVLGAALVIDCLAMDNVDAGIAISGSSGATVRDSVSSGNPYGIQVNFSTSNHRIDNNNVTDNTVVGIQVQTGATGVVVVRNTASGNTANYSIAAGNDAGPIGTAAATTSPWANISN